MMTSDGKTDYEAELIREFLVKRECVLSGKVSKKMAESVRDLIGGSRYRTINDFIEEAIFEKLVRIKEEEKLRGMGE